MCVVVEGRRGGRERRERGRRKSVWTHRQIRVRGLTAKNDVRQLTLNITMKMYGKAVMLRCNHTNLGALNTMAAGLEIAWKRRECPCSNNFSVLEIESLCGP
jgi:hypothetical protein